MKFKIFLKHFFLNIKESISRFTIAFVCSILLFLTSSYAIIFEVESYEIVIQLCMAYAITAVFSVLLKIAQEYIWPKINSIIQYALCIAMGVVGFFLIRENYTSLYTIMAYSGVMIAMICFIFSILMHGENRDLAFPKIVTSWIFAETICIVIAIGLSVCVKAIESLLFSWNDSYKTYLVLGIFVSSVCFINIFLSNIPKKDVPVQNSKIFRAFVLYAGLPLYILLIAILLAYLAKIVITWNMPVGEINWFASFASLFFIFFLLSVMQYSEKIAKLFVKFGGYFLAPILVMQAIAVFERINAYGLTTPRTVSLVLIFISILFIAGSIIIPKHLNKIALISGIIVLIVTVTPFNVIDMPIKSQTNILETVLIENDMLKDGKVTPKSDISDEDSQKIISSYEYLKYDAKKVPDFIPDSTKSLLEIFGVDNTYSDVVHNYVYCRYTSINSVDISEYDKLVEIEDDGSYIIKIEHDGNLYEADLKQIAMDLYTQYGEEKSDMDVYKVNENMSLYIETLRFDLVDDEVSYIYFNGYALLKN